MNKDELFKQYYQNGGKTMQFTSIDIRRDGGTILATFHYLGENEAHTLFRNKNTGTLHLYLLSNEPLTDEPTINHINERLDKFKSHLHHSISLVDRLITKNVTK